MVMRACVPVFACGQGYFVRKTFPRGETVRKVIGVVATAALASVALAAPAYAAGRSPNPNATASPHVSRTRSVSPTESATRSAGGPLASASASSVPPVQVCDLQQYIGNTWCVNREGGGTGNGTDIISWYMDDPNNDFTTANTNWCNQGRVTTTCPFTVGSGLNNRYAGDPIITVEDYDNGKVVAAPGANAGNFNLFLESNGSIGDIDILTAYQDFVNLAASNYNYTHGGGYNRPAWWTETPGRPIAITFAQSLATAWGCEGPESFKLCAG
jgi:hypothetical protein